MLTTIDLTPRHAARLLEQAVRSRVRLDIEPQSWPDGESLRGTLWRREGNLLYVDLDESKGKTEGSLLNLIGAFAEIRTTLGGHVFLFSTCVLDVIEEAGPPRLVLAVPESLQVGNRRRYERTNATVASQVRIWTDKTSPASVGLLMNIGPEGLAAQFVGPGLGDGALVGDEVSVSFELAGFEESYRLPAVVCSKTMSSDKAILSIGLQFVKDTADPQAQQSLQQLAAILNELMSDFTAQEGN